MAPSEVDDVPAAQGVQLAAEAPLQKPAPQGAQTALLLAPVALEEVPAGQPTQDAMVAAGAYAAQTEPLKLWQMGEA